MKRFFGYIGAVGAVGLMAVVPGLTRRVSASVSSCTANITPSSVSGNTTTAFSVTVTNASDTDIRFIQVDVPTRDFSVVGGNSSGWTNSVSAANLTVTGGTLTPSTSYSFIVEAAVTNTAVSGVSWTVNVSDDPSGAGPTSCTGSLSAGISTVTEAAGPPGISDIVVSDVVDSSVKITWTTDQSADSSVDYGTTPEYGSSKSVTTQGTSHSLTLTSLSANTTYHYNVKSTNDNGTGESGDNIFTTAKSGVSGTTQTGTSTSTTTTIIITPKPIPTVAPDLSGPRIVVKTKFEAVYKTPPDIEGIVTDPSGINRVEYSTDGGKNYRLVDDLEATGKTRAFRFSPQLFLDDTYALMVRAYDALGNKATSPVADIVIDRVPPRLGPILVTYGSLVANRDGITRVLAGIPYTIHIAYAGGVTSVDAETSEKNNLSLRKNQDTGLWEGVFMFESAGVGKLTLRARDGAGNSVISEFSPVEILREGYITDDSGTALGDSDVTVYAKDDQTGLFHPWDGRPYGYAGRIKSDERGAFSLILPVGTYYVTFGKSGYVPVTSTIFSVGSEFPVTPHVRLRHAEGVHIGQWFFMFPWNAGGTALQIVPTGSSAGANRVWTYRHGEEFPYHVFSDELSKTPSTLTLRGKPTVVTLLDTWSPQAISQIKVLDTLSYDSRFHVLGVMTHESPGAVNVLVQRGGYHVPLVSDLDDEIISWVGSVYVPTHVILDTKGRVVRVVAGEMSYDELLGALTGAYKQ